MRLYSRAIPRRVQLSLGPPDIDLADVSEEIEPKGWIGTQVQEEYDRENTRPSPW